MLYCGAKLPLFNVFHLSTYSSTCIMHRILQVSYMYFYAAQVHNHMSHIPHGYWNPSAYEYLLLQLFNFSNHKCGTYWYGGLLVVSRNGSAFVVWMAVYFGDYGYMYSYFVLLD